MKPKSMYAGWRVWPVLLVTACAGHQPGAAGAVALGDDAAPGPEDGERSTIVAGSLGARLDSILAHWARDTGDPPVSGAVLVRASGQVILKKAYGYASHSPDRPNDVSLGYDIGSVTKLFTAAAVLSLVDEGRIELSDPFSEYLPEPGGRGASTTLHQALTHSAGLPEYAGGDFDLAEMSETLAVTFGLPTAFEPGSRWAYSNSGYAALAAVVEVVSGMPFEAYLRDRILAPAGMLHTGYVLPEYGPGDVAHAVQSGLDHGAPNEYEWFDDGPSWNLRGNGGLLSTVDDLDGFAMALLGGALLSPASADLYVAAHIPVPEAFEHYGSHYGYGWFVAPDRPEGRLIQHSGQGPMVSDYRIYLDEGHVIVVLSNAQVPSAVALSRSLGALLEAETADRTDANR